MSKSFDLIQELKMHNRVMKLSANETRLRGLLLMLINRKMTLTELSEQIGRSKSTILHHVKKFEKLGVIQRIGKYYVYHPNFLKIFNIELEHALKINPDNKEQLEQLFFRRDLLTIGLLREIFTHVFFLYQFLEKNLESSDIQIKKKSSSYWKSNPIRYNMHLLEEEDLNEYMKIRNNFFNQLNREQTESNQGEKLEVSKKNKYILLESAFPIDSYAKYDADKDSFVSIIGDAKNE
ncbi:MAG: winged helix-turn-helix transcriptional regulator [Candidatus Lokiarchaeota archaeon]|nr:winged helix-turn-helix transcriptional regulator [Candidatus Lokiarchaeota archaeon]